MSKPMCNVHVHTFNAQYVPDKFVGQFFAAFPRTVTKILKSKFWGNGLIKFLGLFNEKSKMGKIIAFLKIGMKTSQYKIFHDLRTDEGYPLNTRFVVLPLNFEFMGAGKVNIPYEQQLNKLVEVAASSNGACLPFVFIDPRMGTAEENRDFVKKYIELKGFVGIKLYPALGYYPFDPRLDLVYKYASENQIPIMTHCSTTGVFYNDSKHIPYDFLHPKSINRQEINELYPNKKRVYDFKIPTKGLFKKKNLDLFADNFLDPINYTDVLQKYKNLKICFAHFGLDNEQHEGRMSVSWHIDIKTLMHRYENVYTDISYSLHYKDISKQFKGYMNDAVLSKKILFGTDFFMTLQEVQYERELLIQTQNSFGDDFEVISRFNMAGYLNSTFFTY